MIFDSHDGTTWWSDHDGHGSGSAESGPDDYDCPCRGGPHQAECAEEAGCGFCVAAEEATRGQGR